MANKSGKFTFAANFNVVAQAPLDTRALVDTVDDLVNENSWQTITHPPYKGMVVSVASTGDLYILMDPKNTTDINSWKWVKSVENGHEEPQIADWDFWKN